MTALMKLEVPPELEREFKRRAKAAWGRELYGILLGTIAGDQIVIEEIFYPENQERFSTHDFMYPQAEWFLDAEEEANESGLVICGTVHSHPYERDETRGRIQDRVLSEDDHKTAPEISLVNGICTIQEIKWNSGMTLRASMRWWGPTIPLKVTYR